MGRPGGSSGDLQRRHVGEGAQQRTLHPHEGRVGERRIQKLRTCLTVVTVIHQSLTQPHRRFQRGVRQQEDDGRPILPVGDGERSDRANPGAVHRGDGHLPQEAPQHPLTGTGDRMVAPDFEVLAVGTGLGGRRSGTGHRGQTGSRRSAEEVASVHCSRNEVCTGKPE